MRCLPPINEAPAMMTAPLMNEAPRSESWDLEGPYDENHSSRMKQSWVNPPP